jgi:hypothetical protein
MALSSTLADWDNFYVITGSAAAGLTGLTFVVIALAKEARRTATTALRAYMTPTIVHFGTVLALAAFLSMPGQSAISLGLGFGAAGAGGLIYAGVIVASMRRYASKYVPVSEDWIWHAILPAVVYATLLVMAFLTRRRPEQSLYGIAAASLLLLFIGIHNSWDVAVSISVNRQDDSSQE